MSRQICSAVPQRTFPATDETVFAAFRAPPDDSIRLWLKVALNLSRTRLAPWAATALHPLLRVLFGGERRRVGDDHSHVLGKPPRRGRHSRDGPVFGQPMRHVHNKRPRRSCALSCFRGRHIFPRLQRPNAWVQRRAERAARGPSAGTRCWATFADQGLILTSLGPIARSATSVS